MDQEQTAPWLMPHPLAYLYRVSKDVDVLKNKMNEYCLFIRQNQQDTKSISQKLFSRKPSNALRWIRLLETLEVEEEKYRTAFQLAKCLWQLEGIMVETYTALIRWRRIKSEMEVLVENDFNCCSCCDKNSNNFNINSRNDCCLEEFLRLQREEDESDDRYMQCRYDQSMISKEIARYLGIDDNSESGEPSPPPPNCDDLMIEYTMRNYCPCVGCILVFNRKDLGIFGMLRGSSSSSDSDDGDNKSPSVSRSYCLECFHRNLVDKETSDIADSSDISVEQRTPAVSRNATTSNTNAVAVAVSTPNKANKTNPTKKRKKKKKKKKVASASLLSSSPPDTEKKDLSSCCSTSSCALQCIGLEGEEEKRDGSILSSSPPDTGRKDHSSCVSTTSCALPCIGKEEEKRDGSLISSSPPDTGRKGHSSCVSTTSCPLPCMGIEEEEKRDELINAKILNRDCGSFSIRESYPATSAFTTTTIHDVIDSNKIATTVSVEDDRNELWVEYLWKTGSMIALDRYMDEMEEILGKEPCQ